MTRELMGIANLCCDGRVVSVLEGGYGHYSRVVGIDRTSLARNVCAHVGALAGHPTPRCGATRSVRRAACWGSHAWARTWLRALPCAGA